MIRPNIIQAYYFATKSADRMVQEKETGGELSVPKVIKLEK